MDKMYQVFMELLKKYDDLSSSCVKVTDPDNPSIKISKFLVIVKGPKTLVKFILLNFALVLFVSKDKMTFVSHGLDSNPPFAYKFQSTTCDTNLKWLFLYFGKIGVNCKH